MPISVKCSCGKSLNLRDEFAGRAVKCPGCSQVVRVPAAGMATAAAAVGKPMAARPNTAANRPAKPIAAPANNSLHDLFAEEGFNRDVASVCPACKTEMTATAVLCTKCGFNKQTGERLTGHKVAGVDIDMGTLALQKAANDMRREVEIQATMVKRSGMPPWMLAMVLFILGSATTIAVLAVNAMNRSETLEFSPMRLFLNLGGSAFAILAIGSLLSIVARAFKLDRKQGFYSLTIVYLLYFIPKNFRLTWRPALMAIVCGGIAGGLFSWASTI